MSNDSDDENTPPGSGPGVGGMPNNWLVPAVLLLLRDVSSYGYDLMKALTRFGFAMMNPGPLYRMLRQMLYSLTEAGEAYLRLWAGSLGKYRRMMDLFVRLYSRQPEDE